MTNDTTRFISTDSDNPWLPGIVKVRSDKTIITDANGDFASTNVEGALAEIVDALRAADLWNPSGTAVPTTTTLASSDPNNVSVQGDSVTFTATVMTVDAPTTPTTTTLATSDADHTTTFGVAVTFTATVTS